MTRANLWALTVDQLAERFAKLNVALDNAQWDALGQSDYSKVKSLIYAIRDIDEELRLRGRDARLALIILYNHQNIQVRLMAAKLTLGVAPTEARKLIEDISQSKIYPQAGDAGMTLSNLDEGVFKPN
jgi:hypothetical protein